MILRLDKGDTKEIFKEFVDTATKEYIDNKIKQLFDKRVESIIKEKFDKINIENEIEGKINQMVIDYFKYHKWDSKCEHMDKVIREELKKIDFERIVTKKFSEELLEELWGKLKIVK